MCWLPELLHERVIVESCETQVKADQGRLTALEDRTSLAEITHSLAGECAGTVLLSAWSHQSDIMHCTYQAYEGKYAALQDRRSRKFDLLKAGKCADTMWSLKWS